MRFGLLGPLEIVDDAGRSVAIGGRQPRMLLAVLLVAGGRAVTSERLLDALWTDGPPASATSVLHSYVSRLRRTLPGAIVRDDIGYRLDADPADVDHIRFERLADDGRALLDAGNVADARRALLDADALWRGPALAEFGGEEFARGLAARLDERRIATMEDRLAADLQLGRHGSVIAELTELIEQHPWRERLREQLALALYRTGRQAEALRVIADAGRTLRDQLGIEPGRQLTDLETAILNHDPVLNVSSSSSVETVSQPQRPASRLAGRSAELDELTAALQASRAAAGFVVLEGEPGIGKTRLADELRTVATEQGALAVWGRSDESGAAPALWPWLVPLRALAAAASEVPPAIAELLAGETPMAAGSAQAMQFERFEAIAALLDDVAARRPVVILLDDLQWADATSLELLGFLAGRAGAAVLVVATVRQLEVGRRDAVTDALAALARRPGNRRLQIRGLSRAATAEMLAVATDQAITPPIAAAIHARAEGNPFYAIELARLLDEEGSLVAEAVPRTVGDVIRRRLARLPEPSTALLTAAAVVGRDVPVELLARTVGVPLDAVLDDLEAALAHRLLVDIADRPGELRFSHALVREVLLDDMTSLRRARLHLKVADAIEAGGAGVDDAEILAEHLWRATPVGVGRRAADALERAAEVALRRIAYGAAEDLLTKAVQLRRATGSTVDDDVLELMAIFRLLEVARASRYFFGALASLPVLDRAKDLATRCGRRDVLLNLLWFEWSALVTSCRLAEADRPANAAISLTLDDPAPDVRALGIQIDAVGLWQAGQVAAAVARFDEAIALVAPLPFPEAGFAAEQRMLISTFWLWSHAVRGDRSPADTFTDYDRLIDAVPVNFVVTSIAGFAATAAVVLGRWDDVERYVAVGLEADRGAQFAFPGGQIQMLHGVGLARRGEMTNAVDAFEGGRRRYTSVNGRAALSAYAASFSIALATHGAVDTARQWCEQALADLETDGEMWNEPVVLIARATIASLEGRRDDAAHDFAKAVRVATTQGSLAIAERAIADAAALGVGLPNGAG